MTSREQLESDAALARRLQEEEFASPIFLRPAPRSPHTPPNSAPPRVIPGAPRQTHGGYTRAPPRQPTPPLPPHQTHPFAQGRPSFSADDMLSELVRRAREPWPLGAPHALDAIPDAPPSRVRNAPTAAANSPESLVESLLGHATRGLAQAGGSRARAGGVVFTPQGITRIDFSTQQGTRGRDGARAPSTGPRGGPQRRHSDRESPRAAARRQEAMRGRDRDRDRDRDRNVPRYPQPQRYPQPGETHYHHIHRSGDQDGDAFRDIGEMLNVVFSDMASAFNHDRMGGRGGAAGMPGGVGGALWEYLQSMTGGGAHGEPQQYEDWLQFIDRMGHVNRGASEAEIGQLPSQRFDKKLLERVRMKRRQREGRSRGGRSGAGASSSAGSSSSNAVEEAEKCAICLGEYEEGEEVKTLPCFHVFHTECVDRWLAVNKICPFCKKSIRPGDEAAA